MQSSALPLSPASDRSISVSLDSEAAASPRTPEAQSPTDAMVPKPPAVAVPASHEVPMPLRPPPSPPQVVTTSARNAATQTSSLPELGATHPTEPLSRWGRAHAWLISDQALAAACGATVGTLAFVCAPVAWPTATLAYNQAIVFTTAAVGTTGAVFMLPQLPYRMLGAAFAGLVGAAIAIECAPCIAPLYLASVALVSAGFGYKASQHLQAITTALMVTGAAGAVWWAATVVGPRFGVAVPQMRWAA